MKKNSFSHHSFYTHFSGYKTFALLFVATIVVGILTMGVSSDVNAKLKSPEIFSLIKAYDQSFVEENDLYIPADAKNLLNSNITEEVFNQIIDKIYEIYSPVVKSKGGVLVIEKNWSDGTVNAYANRSGNTWSVAMFGGLARHEAVTPDGFALVICHELGHHLAGTPKVRNMFSRWASNEGQSDYFSTLKCLRQVMENDNNEEIIAKLSVPAYVDDLCTKSFVDANEIAICKRSAMSGKSVGDLFVALSNGSKINFSTPDRSVVNRTNDSHPASQCRLDTYLAGATCIVDKKDELSDTNVNSGACTSINGHESGLRPTCWYKP
ncbi:MAG: M48 family metalloprotease [Oligoflexia bacterium]|nr:M48 family metalloprotease [Oligoflexia bacterium]